MMSGELMLDMGGLREGPFAGVGWGDVKAGFEAVFYGELKVVWACFPGAAAPVYSTAHGLAVGADLADVVEDGSMWEIQGLIAGHFTQAPMVDRAKRR